MSKRVLKKRDELVAEIEERKSKIKQINGERSELSSQEPKPIMSLKRLATVRVAAVRGVPGAAKEEAELTERIRTFEARQKALGEEAEMQGEARRAAKDELTELYRDNFEVFAEEAEGYVAEALSAVRGLEEAYEEARDAWSAALRKWHPLCEAHGLKHAPGLGATLPKDLSERIPRPPEVDVESVASAA